MAHGAYPCVQTTWFCWITVSLLGVWNFGLWQADRLKCVFLVDISNILSYFDAGGIKCIVCHSTRQIPGRLWVTSELCPICHFLCWCCFVSLAVMNHSLILCGILEVLYAHHQTKGFGRGWGRWIPNIFPNSEMDYNQPQLDKDKRRKRTVIPTITPIENPLPFSVGWNWWILMNGIQQMWWYVTSKIRLQKTTTSVLPTLSLLALLSCSFLWNKLPSCEPSREEHVTRNWGQPPTNSQQRTEALTAQQPVGNRILPATPWVSWKEIPPQASPEMMSLWLTLSVAS